MFIDRVAPLQPHTQEYGRKINAEWDKTVEGILGAGRLLIEAKAKVSHGQFEGMVKQLCRFGPRTAQYLMQIARHPVIQDVQNRTAGAHLPNSVGTLRELARFEPKELSHAIGNHCVKTDMNADDAKRLHRRVKQALGIVGRRVRTKPKTKGRSRVDWVARLRKDWRSASEEERGIFFSEIIEEWLEKRGGRREDRHLNVEQHEVDVEHPEGEHLHLVHGDAA